MSDKKEVFVRLGFSDVVMSKGDAEKVKGYANIVDQDNEYVDDTEMYTIGYEFEDGTECDENGEEL